jgi:hypothetical protein
LRSIPRWPTPGSAIFSPLWPRRLWRATEAGTYNTRALVPEVLVRADEWALVRPRVTAEELIALDRLPPWL